MKEYDYLKSLENRSFFKEDIYKKNINLIYAKHK